MRLTAKEGIRGVGIYTPFFSFKEVSQLRPLL